MTAAVQALNKGMELRLKGSDGLPEDSLVSVRIGSVRRQAQLNSGKAYKFPDAAGTQHMKVDVYARIAHARLILEPGTAQFPVQLDVPSDSTGFGAIPEDPHIMSLDFDVAGGKAGTHVLSDDENDDAGGQKDMAGSARRHKMTMDMQPYFEQHKLMDTVQSLLQAVIQDKPINPYAYMVRVLQNSSSAMLGRKDMPKRATGSRPQSDVRKGLPRAASAGALRRAPKQDGEDLEQPSFMSRSEPDAEAPTDLSGLLQNIAQGAPSKALRNRAQKLQQEAVSSGELSGIPVEEEAPADIASDDVVAKLEEEVPPPPVPKQPLVIVQDAAVKARKAAVAVKAAEPPAPVHPSEAQLPAVAPEPLIKKVLPPAAALKELSEPPAPEHTTEESAASEIQPVPPATAIRPPEPPSGPPAPLEIVEEPDVLCKAPSEEHKPRQQLPDFSDMPLDSTYPKDAVNEREIDLEIEDSKGKAKDACLAAETTAHDPEGENEVENEDDVRGALAALLSQASFDGSLVVALERTSSERLANAGQSVLGEDGLPKAQLSESALRQEQHELCDLLTKAGQDGRLERAVSGIKGHQDTRVGALPDDPDALKQELATLLVEATESGKLQLQLEEKLKQAEEEADQMRGEIRSILERAGTDGRLEAALRENGTTDDFRVHTGDSAVLDATQCSMLTAPPETPPTLPVLESSQAWMEASSSPNAKAKRILTEASATGRVHGALAEANSKALGEKEPRSPKVKAKNGLTEANASGRLHEALSNSKAPTLPEHLPQEPTSSKSAFKAALREANANGRLDEAFAENSKILTDAQAELSADDLKATIADMLAQACVDGKLEQYLETCLKPQTEEGVNELRREFHALLEVASMDGRLQEAVTATAPRGRLAGLKADTLLLLEQACDDGRLDKYLTEVTVASTSETEAPDSPKVQFQKLLSQASRDGSLEEALSSLAQKDISDADAPGERTPTHPKAAPPSISIQAPDASEADEAFVDELRGSCNRLLEQVGEDGRLENAMSSLSTDQLDLRQLQNSVNNTLTKASKDGNLQIALERLSPKTAKRPLLGSAEASEIHHDLGELLVHSTLDGRLEAALQEAHVAQGVLATGSQAAEESGAEDPAKLRKSLSAVLANASLDGSLDGALQKALPEEAQDTAMRRGVGSVLLKATEDGRLQNALVNAFDHAPAELQDETPHEASPGAALAKVRPPATAVGPPAVEPPVRPPAPREAPPLPIGSPPELPGTPEEALVKAAAPPAAAARAGTEASSEAAGTPGEEQAPAKQVAAVVPEAVADAAPVPSEEVVPVQLASSSSQAAAPAVPDASASPPPLPELPTMESLLRAEKDAAAVKGGYPGGATPKESPGRVEVKRQVQALHTETAELKDRTSDLEGSVNQIMTQNDNLRSVLRASLDKPLDIAALRRALG